MYSSKTTKTWVCPSCGHEMKGDKAPDKCPLCQAKMSTFEIPLPKDMAI